VLKGPKPITLHLPCGLVSSRGATTRRPNTWLNPVSRVRRPCVWKVLDCCRRSRTECGSRLCPSGATGKFALGEADAT